MDMTTAIIPKSDQINADSLLAGPRTFTIERVANGNDEQPVNVFLVESPGKPYRPGKSMSRVMVKAWGKDSDAYVGHRLTLYCDPDVKWGGEKVGGIRIAAMSGIDAPLSLSLTQTKGKRAMFTVQPLTDTPARKPSAKQPTPAQIAASSDDTQLRAWWTAGDDAVKSAVTARKAELDATQGELGGVA